MFNEITISYEEIVKEFTPKELKNAKSKFNEIQANGKFTNFTFEQFIVISYADELNSIQILKEITSTVKCLVGCKNNHLEILKASNASDNQIKCDSYYFDVCIDKLLDLGELFQ